MTNTISLPLKYADARQKGDDAFSNSQFTSEFYHYARAVIMLDQAIQSDLRNYNDTHRTKNLTSAYKAFLEAYNSIMQRLDEHALEHLKFDDGINWNALYSRIHNSLGGILDILQKTQDALQEYDLALLKNPNNAAAHNNKGQIYAHEKNFDAALREYNAALHIKPRMIWALLNKGIIFRTLKQYDHAILFFEKVLSISAKNTEAFHAIGFIKYNQEQYNDACKYYNKAWKSLIFHQKDIAKKYLGIDLKSILLKNKRNKKANQKINKKIKLKIKREIEKSLKRNNNPTSIAKVKKELKKIIKTYIGVGLLYCEGETPKFDTAIYLFLKAIDLDIDDTCYSAYTFIGTAYEKQARLASPSDKKKKKGLFNKALKYYNLAIKYKEKDCQIYAKVGRMLIELHKYEECLDLCNKNLGKIPFFPALVHDCFNLLKPADSWAWIQTITSEENVSAFSRILFMNSEFWVCFLDDPSVIGKIYLYDGDYRTLQRFEDAELNSTNGHLECIQTIWGYQKYLLHLLNAFPPTTSETDNHSLPSIAHYTSESTLNIFMSTPPHEGHDLKMFSIAVANDPQEGKILQHLLDTNPQEFLNGYTEEKWMILQACFTSEVDSLNQFRLYGKKEYKEGTGFCLELNPSYFATISNVPMTLHDAANASITITPKQPSCNKKTSPFRRPLYHVIYYDPETGGIYYAPASEEWYAKLDSTDLGGKVDIKHHEQLKQIRYALRLIKTKFNSLKGKAQIQAWSNLIFTRHLVKHAAFRNEKELRIISVNELGDANLHFLEKPDCHTINYLSIMDKDYLKTVISGPKVQDFDRLSEKWLCRLHQYRNNHGQPITHTTFRQSTSPWRH